MKNHDRVGDFQDVWGKQKVHHTIDYIVYPPNYDFNVDRYYEVDTFKKARKLALKLGSGAEVYRKIAQQNSRGGSFYTRDGWEVVHGKYFTEIMRKGRYHPDLVDPTIKAKRGQSLKLKKDLKVRDANFKYAPIFRRRR